MGYRDDFYVVQNIVGYTGPLHELPSVYFKTKTEFGHITQVHKGHFNWGRHRVKTDPGWELTNTCPGEGICYEFPHAESSHEVRGDGSVAHVSRAPCVLDLTQDAVAVLAEAIYLCPLMKTDPGETDKRHRQQEIYKHNWRAAHQRGPSGRRGAIDYTGQRLANFVLGAAHPDRLK